MPSYSFKELVSAFRNGIINQRLFEKRLTEYVKNVFIEAKNGNYAHILNLSNGLMLNNVMIDSIVERIVMSVFCDVNGFYLATKNYNELNEITGITEDSYEIFHCLEPKVVLGSVKSEDNKKNIKISIGLATGTVFVGIDGKKFDRLGDELMSSTYALADYNLIDIIDKVSNDRYVPSGNYVENSVICNRFDPSHMQTNNTNGALDGNDHPNKFEAAGITDLEELTLYKKYFKDKAKCPHFHFFQKRVCDMLRSNGASFAIHIADLANYLEDLEEAYNNKRKDDPILKYDLGMPYLDIIKGKIACDSHDFIRTAKSIFNKYYGGNKSSGINLLYDMIDKAYSGNNIGCFVAGAKILCFVNTTPFDHNESMNDRLNLQMDDASKSKDNITMTAKLAREFADMAGSKLDAKKLLSSSSDKNEKSDDDEPNW